jgi:antibiotic biosynthesis monooxygenase (ABM) superfamily enzyme
MSQPLPHPSPDHHVDHDVTPAPTAPARRSAVGPPNKHELAVMIWVAVFPTLTALNLTLGHWLTQLNPVVRTFTLATIAVPVVIYGLMPRLHALRGRLLTLRAA